MNKMVIITGPTAVGKTDISIKLAKRINGEIISADSIQVYKDMNIGSAKIQPEEMDGIKHYLIDILKPDEEFNVHIFQKMAQKAINEIYNNGKIPIIVGGTGFYIQSVLYDIDFEETKDSHNYRLELEQLAKDKGKDYIHEKLKKIDRESAMNIHPNNLKRVIRALEYYYDTGNLISEHNDIQSKKNSPYNFSYFVLNDYREDLYKKIDLRVDKMIEQGLVLEIRKLLDCGYSENMVSMQGIGYKEIISYCNNQCTLEEAIDLIKKNTRHFAKRQLTWFKREKDVTMINKYDFNYETNKILEAMINNLKDKKIIEE